MVIILSWIIVKKMKPDVVNNMHTAFIFLSQKEVLLIYKSKSIIRMVITLPFFPFVVCNFIPNNP